MPKDKTRKQKLRDILYSREYMTTQYDYGTFVETILDEIEIELKEEDDGKV